MDWRAEAEEHAKDVRVGVTRVHVDREVDSNDHAVIDMTTLEGESTKVCINADGCQVMHVPSAPIYDSLHSLLMNVSSGYRDAFNAGLKAKLQALVEERGGY
mmetsp:Transcript_21736/g.64092  ORF Transcript_21736/g.64092 Transcript_21736/m.64092 type:complete len:102 (-) Transcript_21736:234-539(-)